MNRDTSIVQALISRSFNGRKLGLHVHQHKGMEIHACWYIIPSTGHYFRNCISRRIKSFEEYDFFLARSVGEAGWMGLVSVSTAVAMLSYERGQCLVITFGAGGQRHKLDKFQRVSETRETRVLMPRDVLYRDRKACP